MKLSVVAHPNNKRPRVEKDSMGVLHVNVSGPPTQGKANKALVDLLAGYFHVPKSCVEIHRGFGNKNKLVEIFL